MRERCGKAVSSKSANLRIAQQPFEAVKTGRQAAKLRIARGVREKKTAVLLLESWSGERSRSPRQDDQMSQVNDHPDARQLCLPAW